MVNLDLGNLSLTGFFPLPDQDVDRFQLSLGKCQRCGLTQLAHQIPIEQLYGSTYGYESHLNSEMRNHLLDSAASFEVMFGLVSGDAVLDIASNDGTLLNGYVNDSIEKYGIDPLALVLSDNYPK